MDINLDPAGRFAVCWPKVLLQECPYPNDWSNAANFSNDPRDPGGATMCGVIQAEYDIWRQAHALMLKPVRQITQAEGQAIYWANYWVPALLPVGLDLSVFDARVNIGVFGTTRLLQRTLGLAADGIWGPQTDAAVATADVRTAIRVFAENRLAYYKSLPTFADFGDDWTRRTQQIEGESFQCLTAAGRAKRYHTPKGYAA